MDQFFCRNCMVFLPMEMRKKGNPVKKENPRGICKPCHNKVTYQTAVRKLADKFPFRYLTCNECDSTFAKTQQSFNPLTRTKKLQINCPYCESEEIEAY